LYTAFVKYCNEVQSRSEVKTWSKALDVGEKGNKGAKEEKLLYKEIKTNIFQVKVYNGCCAGLRNKKIEGIEQSLCVYRLCFTSVPLIICIRLTFIY
jgi:hypothetical protein